MDQTFPEIKSIEELRDKDCVNGLYTMASSLYHEPFGMGSHSLRKVLESPLKFRHSLTVPLEETQALVFGRAVHTAVLEPFDFDDQYVQKPIGTDRRTKAGKDSYAAFEAASHGKTILDHEQWSDIVSIVKTVSSHEIVSKLLDTSVFEVSGYLEDGEVVRKIRPDLMSREFGVIGDLKTTQDASPYSFNREIYDRGYHIQAAYYVDTMFNIDPDFFGGNVPQFVFIAVEKKAPFEVACYVIDDQWLALGRAGYEKALKIYAECVKTNVWPGYPTSIETLSPPEWVLRK